MHLLVSTRFFPLLIRTISPICILLLATDCVSAQTGKKSNPGRVSAVTTNDHYMAFSINNLFNYYGNNGGGSYNNFTGNSGLEFPAGTWNTVGYAEGVLWGGYHMGRPVPKVGGSEYRHALQAGRIITPGTPLGPGLYRPNCVADDPALSKYRLYRVRRDIHPGLSSEVMLAQLEREAAMIARYEGGTTAASLLSQYILDWNQWPAKGSTTDPQGLAPFEDRNGNGLYDPAIDIPGQIGADQTLYYVANDNDTVRTNNLAGCPPIGLEMHRTIWGYARIGQLENVIFASTVLINKSGSTVDSMYLAGWTDADVGNGGDDFTACDSALDLGYVYNADALDATYGTAVPASGILLLSGPTVAGTPSDSAIVGLRYRRGIRNLGMTSFSIHTGSAVIYADPIQGTGGDAQRYCLLRGAGNRSCVPIIDPTTGLPTLFPYAGDPIRNTGFTPEIYGKSWDWRFLVNSGPFTFANGDTQEIVTAQIVAQGEDRLQSVAELKSTASQVIRAYRDLLVPRPFSTASVTFPDPSTADIRIVSNTRGSPTQGVSAILRRGNGSVAATIPLYDDGTHGDTLNRDGIFSGSGRIPVERVPLSVDCETIDDQGARRLFAGVADEVTVAGRVTAGDLVIFSDNLNDDLLANFYENVRFGFTLTNATPFSLNEVSFNTTGTTRPPIPLFAPGARHTLRYDPGQPTSYLSITLPSRLEGSDYLIPVILWDGSGNVWTDTLRMPVVPLRYAPKEKRAIHLAGSAYGDFGVLVTDKRLVKNHRYRIKAFDPEGVSGIPTFSLEDSSDGRVLLEKHPFPDPLGHTMPVTDGFKIVQGSVISPGSEGVSASVTSGVSFWTSSGGSGGLALEAAGGSIGSGVRSWPSGGVWYGRLKDVEIRFSATDTLGLIASPGDTNISFAYRYLAGAGSPPAQPGFAPYIVRTGPGYAYQDYLQNLPFAAYDVNASPARRLMVGYLENNVASGLVNGRYWPPRSSIGVPPANNNVDSLGPREWFFVFDVSYSATPDPSLQVDLRSVGTRLMWFGTPARARASLSLGDRFRINVQNSPATGDLWAFNPVDLIGGIDETIPDRMELFPNYPNPFNTGTTIKYGLPADSRVILKIYNILGQEVRRLVDEIQLEGYRKVVWDGRNNTGREVATGLYILRGLASTLGDTPKDFVFTQKMLLLR